MIGRMHVWSDIYLPNVDEFILSGFDGGSLENGVRHYCFEWKI